MECPTTSPEAWAVETSIEVLEHSMGVGSAGRLRYYLDLAGRGKSNFGSSWEFVIPRDDRRKNDVYGEIAETHGQPRDFRLEHSSTRVLSDGNTREFA